MSTRILRWGLLGTAHINRALIPPLRASNRNQLVAVASRTTERAQAYAREWASRVPLEATRRCWPIPRLT